MAAKPRSVCPRCGNFVPFLTKAGEICDDCVRSGHTKVEVTVPIRREDWTVRSILDHCLTTYKQHRKRWTLWTLVWLGVAGLSVWVILWGSRASAPQSVSSKNYELYFFGSVFAFSLVTCLYIRVLSLDLQGREPDGLDLTLLVRVYGTCLLCGGVFLIVMLSSLLVVWFTRGLLFGPGTNSAQTFPSGLPLATMVLSSIFMPFLLIESFVSDSPLRHRLRNALVASIRAFPIPILWLALATVFGLSGLLVLGLGVLVTMPLAVSSYCCLYLVLRQE